MRHIDSKAGESRIARSHSRSFDVYRAGALLMHYNAYPLRSTRVCRYYGLTPLPDAGSIIKSVLPARASSCICPVKITWVKKRRDGRIQLKIVLRKGEGRRQIGNDPAAKICRFFPSDRDSPIPIDGDVPFARMGVTVKPLLLGIWYRSSRIGWLPGWTFFQENVISQACSRPRRVLWRRKMKRL